MPFSSRFKENWVLEATHSSKAWLWRDNEANNDRGDKDFRDRAPLIASLPEAWEQRSTLTLRIASVYVICHKGACFFLSVSGICASWGQGSSSRKLASRKPRRCIWHWHPGQFEKCRMLPFAKYTLAFCFHISGSRSLWLLIFLDKRHPESLRLGSCWLALIKSCSVLLRCIFQTKLQCKLGWALYNCKWMGGQERGWSICNHGTRLIWPYSSRVCQVCSKIRCSYMSISYSLGICWDMKPNLPFLQVWWLCIPHLNISRLLIHKAIATTKAFIWLIMNV